MRLSITARLVVMFAVAMLATLTLIGAALYVVLQRDLRRHQDAELATNLQNMVYSIERAGTAERWGRVQAKMDTLTPADGSMRFWVLSDDPSFQYGKGLAEMANLLRNADGSGSLELPQQAYPLRTLSRAVGAFGDRPAVRLIVASDSAPFMQTLNRFLGALVALSITTVLGVTLVGHWIARIGLRPLRRLSEKVRALGPQAPGERLEVSHLPDELSDLAASINGALGRLEDAYRQLETFNADVAHELRTPLTNLIGGTQVALSRPRSVPELEDILHSNLEELEQVRLIINDMLFLARADQGEAATNLVVTPLAGEITKSIAFYEVLLDELGATVEIVGDVDAEAPIETALFRRAVSNLLQNAIEHSARGAAIRIAITRGSADVRIAVSNPGEPIAESHLPRLFDRFYRVDAARSLLGTQHGHGLGLAIVKAVATMHSGPVMAMSSGGQTTIGFGVRSAAMGASR